MHSSSRGGESLNARPPLQYYVLPGVITVSTHLSLVSLWLILLLGPTATAAVHVLDPTTGGTLAGAVSAGLLHAGDTAVLRSGYHGAVTLSGDNAELITITAAPGQTPQLSRLVISQGSKWLVRGVVISPSFAAEPYKGNIVSLGESGPSSDLTIADCFIYTTLDSSAWTIEQWMSANSGVQLGRHGTKLTMRNNHLLNLRFGVALCSPDSLCEGNLIENFSADGIRVTRDDLTVRCNTIRNVYVGSKDGDDNHDDGIQAFLFNKGTGTVRKARVLNNIIINRENPAQPFPASLQGIGFFDGPLVDFQVAGNVVDVQAWHGIALYDAQNCTITGNSVFNTTTDHTIWIMLGQKHKQFKDNTVTGNFSNDYKLKSPGLTQDKNEKITAEAFHATQLAMLKSINDEFGPLHPLTGLPRIGKPGNGVVVKGYKPFVKPKVETAASKPALKPR